MGGFLGFLGGVANTLGQAAPIAGRVLDARADRNAKALALQQEQERLQKQDALQQLATQRQGAQDALARRVQMHAMGYEPAEGDPRAQLNKLQVRNEQLGGRGAIPNAAFGGGPPPELNPDTYGAPSLQSVPTGHGGPDETYVRDPYSTDLAQRERHDFAIKRQAAADKAALDELNKRQADEDLQRRGQAALAGIQARYPKHAYSAKGYQYRKELADEYITAEKTADAEAAKVLAPQTNLFLPSVGPDGKTTYTQVQQHGEANPTPTGIQKPDTTGLAAQMRDPGKASGIASGIAQMENAHAAMQPYEQKLYDNQAKIGLLSDWIAHLGSDFNSTKDLKHSATMTGALWWLNQQDQELAQYVRRAMEYAQGESQVYSRPSDFRVKMSEFLARARAGAHGQMLNDIYNTRESQMQPLRLMLKNYYAQHPEAGAAPTSYRYGGGPPSTPGGGRAAGGQPTNATPTAPGATPSQVRPLNPKAPAPKKGTNPFLDGEDL